MSPEQICEERLAEIAALLPNASMFDICALLQERRDWQEARNRLADQAALLKRNMELFG